VLVAWPAAHVLAQTPATAAGPDPVAVMHRALERALVGGNREAFAALFADGVARTGMRLDQDELFRPGITQAIVKERDRMPLEGVAPGDGYRSVIDVFMSTPTKARVLTAAMDVQRPAGGALESWRIVTLELLSSVEGIYKLRLNTSRPFAARNFVVTSEDLELVLDAGAVFQIECDDGVTGLVMVGRGTMKFSPAPAAERGQLRIFAGTESLATPFETAFVRLSPSDYAKRAARDRLVEQPADARQTRRAQQVFARESGKTFAVNLEDVTTERWHLLPPADDFVAEIETRRFDTLTYSRSSVQAEDVSLYQRDQKRTIALYASAAKIAARGRFYSDDASREYDVLDYTIDVSVVPERSYIEARARMQLRVRSTSVSTVMLRLEEGLAVKDVTSVEYGPLLHLRVRGQNALLVSLPRVAPQDSDLTLIIRYAGQVDSQELDVDTVAVLPDPQEQTLPSALIEPHFLLSSRVVWYPQNPVSDYATGTLRVTVPSGYRVIASGAPVPSDNVVSLRDLVAQGGGVPFTFRADQPLRYMGFAVSRFVRAEERQVTVDTGRPGADIDAVTLTIETQPRLQGRARQLATQAQNILAFYSSLIGEAPFPAMTIGLVESETPGGHSPGYFVLLNDPVPNSNVSWRADPASFDSFPEFFIAHELAHQWWGQAIGWKNYHEQWLSEGFAQYFAALWAQRSRGDRVFSDMLRQFRRWSLADSDQGPVHLGYRLGHIKSDLRVYRAVVYNKGAAVLHMLRRLVGDEAFFAGLRRFYEDRRFQKAGTDDFERAIEAETGRNLDRFFERWIYGTGIPRLSYHTAVSGNVATVTFEQRGDTVFDLPVTVTVTGTDGRTREFVVEVNEASVTRTLQHDRPIRQVQVNRDNAALAEFDER
jgi:hypothetical protein